MTTTGTDIQSSLHPPVRVLVCDDHEVMRMGIRNLLLGRSGWSVCAEASNGEEAVEKALRFQPDVVIMDINMPVMNGLEAAQQIYKAQPKIPVILVFPPCLRRSCTSLARGRHSRRRGESRRSPRSGAGGGNRISWWDFFLWTEAVIG